MEQDPNWGLVLTMGAWTWRKQGLTLRQVSHPSDIGGSEKGKEDGDLRKVAAQPVAEMKNSRIYLLVELRPLPDTQP